MDGKKFDPGDTTSMSMEVEKLSIGATQTGKRKRRRSSKMDDVTGNECQTQNSSMNQIQLETGENSRKKEMLMMDMWEGEDGYGYEKGELGRIVKERWDDEEDDNQAINTKNTESVKAEAYNLLEKENEDREEQTVRATPTKEIEKRVDGKERQGKYQRENTKNTRDGEIKEEVRKQIIAMEERRLVLGRRTCTKKRRRRPYVKKMDKMKEELPKEAKKECGGKDEFDFNLAKEERVNAKAKKIENRAQFTTSLKELLIAAVEKHFSEEKETTQDGEKKHPYFPKKEDNFTGELCQESIQQQRKKEETSDSLRLMELKATKAEEVEHVYRVPEKEFTNSSLFAKYQFEKEKLTHDTKEGDFKSSAEENRNTNPLEKHEQEKDILTTERVADLRNTRLLAKEGKGLDLQLEQISLTESDLSIDLTREIKKVSDTETKIHKAAAAADDADDDNDDDDDDEGFLPRKLFFFGVEQFREEER